MTGRAGLWLACGTASLALHASAFAFLQAAVAPDSVALQKRAETTLDIAPHAVDRVEALPAEPNASTLTPGDAPATSVLGQGIVATTARPAAMTITPSPAISGARPTLEDVSSSAVTPTVSPGSLSGRAASLAPAALATPIVSSGDTQTAPLAAVSPAPTQAVSSTTEDFATSARALPPAALPLAGAEGAVQQVAFQPLPSERQTAVQAWSGGAGVAMDAQSLETVQALMGTSDPDVAGEVRDGLASVLRAPECARLQALFEPETGELRVIGHIPDPAEAPAIVATLQSFVGSGIPIRADLRTLPRPQCTALSGIAALGVPQSSEQLTNPRVVGPDAFARAFDYAEGDRLVLELQAPDFDAFLYVDYFDAAGQVIHLAPNDFIGAALRPAESLIRIGDADGAGPDIRIGPPFGQEIAVALAVSEPLHGGARPLAEPAGPYLAWLKTRIAELRAEHPGFKAEWAYFFVTTRP